MGFIDDLARRNQGVPKRQFERFSHLAFNGLTAGPKVMASPPTISAIATATAIASPQIYNFLTANSAPSPGFPSFNENFITTTIGAWIRSGVVFPDYNYADAQGPTDSVPGSNWGRLEFFTDAQTFEFMHKGLGAKWRMWVDGELVQAAAVPVTADGGAKWQPIVFASQQLRHIKLDYTADFRFGGITIGPTDAIFPAPAVNPRALVIGDSYVVGTNSDTVNGFVNTMGAYLGWDCWAAGVGGSGFDAADSPSSYRDRIGLYSGIPFDVVIIVGSVNDADAIGQASAQAEVPLCFQLARAQWPDALLIGVSPWRPKGVEGLLAAGGTFGGRYRTIGRYIQEAVDSVDGCYVDLISIPFTNASRQLTGPGKGTIQASVNASATTFTSDFQFGIGSTIDIGADISTSELRRVTAVSGTGPYTMTVAALNNAHRVDEVVRQVGASWCTGLGRVGATTGVGTADRYMHSDDVHPTQAAHDTVGRLVATQIANFLTYPW